MDHSFTARIKAWLDAGSDSRDLAAGARMLLRLTGNRIMYANIMADPAARAPFIEEQLRTHYNFRVLELTRDQVAAIDAQAEAVVDSFGLDSPKAAEDPGEVLSRRMLGRRPDHDSLPDEIRALYSENLDLLRRMREAHLQLRRLTLSPSLCHDSERYPFVTALIRLDKRLHDNWRAYDGFGRQGAGDSVKS